MGKVATPEQKQKAAERRERFRAIAKQVSAMSEDQRAQLVASFGAIVTCEGRALSVHNSCLLITQRPGVSMVGGFRQWKDKGRSVRKGETGLALWVPTSRKNAEGETEEERRGFIMGTVFDVSQTDEIAG
jgi:hypothetical protein